MLRTLLLLATAVACAAQSLPHSEPLTEQHDLAAMMLDGLERFLDRKTAESEAARRPKWQLDDSSPAAWKQAIEPKRDELRRILGAFDQRVSPVTVHLDATVSRSSLLAKSALVEVHAVHWNVLDGVDAEGLLIRPQGPVRARIVAIPDADWSPEMLAGLTEELPRRSQFARSLAERGCEVLVPTVISRRPVGAANPRVLRASNQTRREFVYRMAFEMGRHLIGYEVQKVLAAVDWFSGWDGDAPIGVVGYGEGGLLALYSAALDERIDAAAVSGYFGPRDLLWKEPLYRNVWGLLTEFGDAEIAALIAPRPLTVEAARGPERVEPVEVEGLRSYAAPGVLKTPVIEAVRREVDRSRAFYDKLHAAGKLTLIAGERGGGDPGSDEALSSLMKGLGVDSKPASVSSEPLHREQAVDSVAREQRQFDQLMEFTQQLVRDSEGARKQFWSDADFSSVEQWNATKKKYQKHLHQEVLGKVNDPMLPMTAKTRKAYEGQGWKGYEVVLPVWRDVFAFGVLLIPESIPEGEKRPVVVMQHGRGGRPVNLIEPPTEAMLNSYRRVAADLAERGFVVYVPQNPYIFEERYRLVQRRANPLKLSLFSFIVGQHARTLEWLATLPFVDAERIGFYGKSYGGKTALRVPTVLDGYALAIISGDYNEYVGKMAAIDRSDSFLYTEEYEMYEFNLGNTFGYADLATLLMPRPFMVERGRLDGIARDWWVAFEFAKAERRYVDLSLEQNIAMEMFQGGHVINATGTYEFLHRHLRWPEPSHRTKAGNK